MEIFDIVNEFGEPTGETVERTEAHDRGILHRTAHIWILREEEGELQVLLQKRSLEKDSFPGGLDTSSAGHIQAGDGVLESAQRELEEELGICAAPEDLIPIGTFRVDLELEFHGKPFRDQEIAFVFAYEKSVDASSLRLQEEEVMAVEWHGYEEARAALERDDPLYVIPPQGLKLVGDYWRRKKARAQQKN